MIHYSCDLCRRPLIPEDEVRYVVKLEVFAACDGIEPELLDSDRDNLAELHEILEGLDANGDSLEDDACQSMRFDLCSDCRKKFLKNPLGRKQVEQFDFSKN